jgi:hypothetical protein
MTEREASGKLHKEKEVYIMADACELNGEHDDGPLFPLSPLKDPSCSLRLMGWMKTLSISSTQSLQPNNKK